MRFSLFAFGKIKTAGLRETADYYSRLLRPWMPFEEIELKPVAVPDKSPESRIRIQNLEGKLLLEKIKTRAGGGVSNSGGRGVGGGRNLIYLLDEKGKSLSTNQWAREIGTWENQSIANVSFCIGSSLGFSDELRSASHGSFSFGPQTLPHELARVVLLEQLFRASSFHKGHPYHNDGS